MGHKRERYSLKTVVIETEDLFQKHPVELKNPKEKMKSYYYFFLISFIQREKAQ